MADAPDPAIITPSYQPLHRKNEHWGDPCEPSQVCEGPEFIRIYSQNVNGISDHEGIMYEQSMKTMKEAEASIFAFNETHGDDLNAKHNSLVYKAKNRIFNHTDGKFCQTVTSSSNAPITSFTKPGGNMMGINGPLVGRLQRKISDKYGRWCGFVLLGKDNREILILTAYNVPQDTPAGDDTLHAQ